MHSLDTASPIDPESTCAAAGIEENVARGGIIHERE